MSDTENLLSLKQAMLLHEMKNQLHQLNFFHGIIEQNQALNQDPSLSEAIVKAQKTAFCLENDLVRLLIESNINAKNALNIEQCWLKDIIDYQVYRYHQTFFRDKDAFIDSEVNDDFYWYVDERLLGTSLLNALMNAFQAGAIQVFISVAREEDWCKIIVDDDGPGFGKKKDFNANKKSSSIGLKLTEQACRLHVRNNRQGYITMSNHSSLGGARVCMYLP